MYIDSSLPALTVARPIKPVISNGTYDSPTAQFLVTKRVYDFDGGRVVMVASG